MKIRSSLYFILFVFCLSSLSLSHLPGNEIKWSLQNRLKVFQKTSFTGRKLRVYSPTIGDRFLLPKFIIEGQRGEEIYESSYPSNEIHQMKEGLYFFSKMRWANLLFSSSLRMEGDEINYSREVFRNISKQLCQLFPRAYKIRVEKEVIKFETAFSTPLNISNESFLSTECDR